MPLDAFGPADALRFLGFLRQQPTRRPAQRLGLSVLAGGERPVPLLSPASVNRVLAGVSSFFEWAIAAEEYRQGESRCSESRLSTTHRLIKRYGPPIA